MSPPTLSSHFVLFCLSLCASSLLTDFVRTLCCDVFILYTDISLVIEFGQSGLCLLFARVKYCCCIILIMILYLFVSLSLSLLYNIEKRLILLKLDFGRINLLSMLFNSERDEQITILLRKSPSQDHPRPSGKQLFCRFYFLKWRVGSNHSQIHNISSFYFTYLKRELKQV